MSNQLHLKSRLLREGDPMQADISQFKIPLAVDEAVYQRDLLNFRRRFAATEEAEEVAAQDMATLTCRSELPRFCKEHITVRIGQGIFSKELEQQLFGWKRGQSGTVTVKGKPVEVTVEDIRRERLPEVDDALAARCGVPGIRTAADIHAHCRGKQFDDELEGPQDEAFPVLTNQVIQASAFELDPEELAFSEELMVRQFINGAMHGQPLESVPDEEFQERFFCSKEDLLTNLHTSAIYNLQATLLGMAQREREGRPATEEDYAAWLRRFLDVGGKSEAEARREHTALEYLLEQVGGDYMDALEDLTLLRLKEDLK